MKDALGHGSDPRGVAAHQTGVDSLHTLTPKEFVAQYNADSGSLIGMIRKLPTEKHVNGTIAYLQSMIGKVEGVEESAKRLQQLLIRYPKNSDAPKSKYYDNQR